ncbi:MAG: hypothetical protein AB8U44_00275 [Aaplasma endosymbiont of Hyalomma asiaticum]
MIKVAVVGLMGIFHAWLQCCSVNNRQGRTKDFYYDLRVSFGNDKMVV